MKAIILRFVLAGVFLSGLIQCAPRKEVSGALRIAVIPKGTTHEFWEAVHAGARKAEQEMRAKGIEAEIIWKGPLREDDRDFQIQVVETFASTGVDGIVLAPLDDTALVAPVEMAMRSEVPVVIIDSGINTEEYVSFVATDNFKGGQMAGNHLAQLLGEDGGNVVLFRYQVGSASTTKREEGFLEAISHFPKINVISKDQYGGATVDAAFNKAQSLLSRQDIVAAVNGIFCPNETTTVAMTKALREINRARGDVKIIGFDTGRQSLVDMENGDLQGLIVQNPLGMGYLGVATIANHLGGEKIERRVDTGVALVTADNMNEPQIQELLNPPVDQFLKGQ